MTTTTLLLLLANGEGTERERAKERDANAEHAFRSTEQEEVDVARDKGKRFEHGCVEVRSTAEIIIVMGIKAKINNIYYSINSTKKKL